MTLISLLALLISIHFIADFPFQGDWLGVNKGKSWELMIYHCLIYTGTFFIVFDGELPFSVVSLLFFSHLIIDPLKARYKLINHIWVDQILHIAVLISIVPFIVEVM